MRCSGIFVPCSREVSRLARLMDRPRAERDTIIKFCLAVDNKADFELLIKQRSAARSWSVCRA